MKRGAFLSVLVVLMVMCGMSWGQMPPGGTFKAFQFPDELVPVIDGELSDWSVVENYSSYVITSADLGDLMGREMQPLDDWDCRLYVGWNASENMLYFGAKVMDDIWYDDPPDSTGESSSGDNVFVIVDADNSGGDYPEASADGITTQMYLFRLLGWEEVGFVMVSFDTLGHPQEQWSTESPWIESVYDDAKVPAVVIYEWKMAIWDRHDPGGPDFSDRHILAEEEMIGLELVFVDVDSDPGNPDCVPVTAVPDSGMVWGDAGFLSDFVLMPIEPELLDPNRSVLWDVFVVPKRAEPEGPVTIRATVTDPQGVSLVRSDIESPDGTVVGSVDLVDDGTGGDPIAGDSTYTGNWTTEVTAKDYKVDLTIVDGSDITTTYDNRLSFTTINRSPILMPEGSGVDPGFCSPGDVVLIRARGYDPDGDGVASVFADIESPDENLVATVELFDDGAHGDWDSGDDVYANTWVTGGEELDYHVDIRATDGHATRPAEATYDNVLWFSTVNYSPELHWFNVYPYYVLEGREVTLEAKLYDRHGVREDSVFVEIERHEDGTRERVFLNFDRFDEGDWGCGVIFKGTWIAGSPGGYTAMLSACDSTGMWLWDAHHRGVHVAGVVLGTPNHRGMITAPGDTTVKVPVYISDVTGRGILSVELGIDYNPAVLAIPESGFIQTAGTLTEGWGAYWDTLDFTPESHPDFPLYNDVYGLRIAMAGSDSLDSYGQDSVLVYLVFDIADGAHHGYETRLLNWHLLVNEEPWAVWMEGGVTLGEYGDVNKSGKSSEFDAALLLMHAVGIVDLYMLGRQEVAPGDSIDVYEYTHDVADVTGNGQPTAYDAAHILQYSVELIDHFPAEDPYWPWYHSAGPAKPRVSVAKEITLADMRALGGETFALPIRIDDIDGVVSGEMTLSYDPNRWKALGAEKAQLLEEHVFVGRILDGEVRIAFAGAEPRTGAGEIALIRFRALTGGASEDPGFVLDEVVLNEGNVPVTIRCSVEAAAMTPSVCRLGQNYPNPFNPTTVIGFDLWEEGRICLEVYDLAGQKVRTLVDEHRSAGFYSVVWDGKDNRGRSVASGVYFYRIRVNGFVQAKKLVVIQ